MRGRRQVIRCTKNPNPVSCEQTRYRYELAMGMCMEIAEADDSLLQRRYDLEVVS